MNDVRCGDSVEELKKISSDIIDLTITSPPYDGVRDFKGHPWSFKETAGELFRVTKPGGVVVWVTSDAVIEGSESGISFKQALYFKEIGFKLFDTMIFHKKNGAKKGSGKTYNQRFEFMFVFSKGMPKTTNLITDIKNTYRSAKKHSTTREIDGSLKVFKTDCSITRTRDNIFSYLTGYMHSSKDKEAFEHPAIFPEQLAKDHITSWSNEGDLILDPFAGSGTVLKMAKLTNRNFIGIEISREYCEIIKKRLAPYNNQLIEAWQ